MSYSVHHIVLYYSLVIVVGITGRSFQSVEVYADKSHGISISHSALPAIHHRPIIVALDVDAELDGDRVIITRRLSGEEIADRIEQMKGPDFYESTQALRGKTIDEIRDSKEVSDYYKEKYNV